MNIPRSKASIFDPPPESAVRRGARFGVALFAVLALFVACAAVVSVAS